MQDGVTPSWGGSGAPIYVQSDEGSRMVVYFCMVCHHLIIKWNFKGNNLKLKEKYDSLIMAANLGQRRLY